MKRTSAASAEKGQGVLARLSKENREKIIKGFAAAALGLLFSLIRFSDRLSPFGVSALAALSGGSSVFALLGATIGYLSPGLELGGVRYIAQMLILMAVKWAFAAFFETEQKWALPLSAAAVNLAVGSVMLFSDGTIVYDILYLIAESVICGGGVYFVSQAFKIFENGGSMQSAENVVSFSVCAALALMSLSALKIGMVSVGHVVAAVVVMALSYSLGALGGACAGLAIGTALSIGAADGGFSVMVLGFGGMLSGLFSHTSRYASSLLFLACTLLSVAVGSTDSESLYLLYEVLSATVIFLLVPERYIKALGVYFPAISAGREHYPNKYLSTKLDFVSKSLMETSRSICEMSDKLSFKTANDMDRVFSTAADRVCRRCGMKLSCWDSSYTDTMDSFNHMIPALKRQGRIEPENIPDQLRRRCTKMTALVSEINAAYHRNLSEAQTAQRLKQIKEVVTEQFSGMSRLLCEMSQELSLTMCDRETENKISGSLLREGLSVKDVSCPVDKFGRKTVEFYCLSDEIEGLDNELLEDSISELCGTKMQRGSDIKTKELTRLCFTETPPFEIESASFQKNADGESVCGDSFAFLSLNNGFSAAVLSDGMGRGKSAAVDSRMTVNLVSRFLSLGFPLENCMSLVNSALNLKSEDETLATLDATIFDLYNGSICIKKAGAAPTFLKRGKRVSKVEIGALPLGILGEVKVRGAEIKLSRGDVVVMGSDGLCAVKDSQIEALLKKSDGLSCEQIAAALGQKAAESDGDAAGDDITVLVMRLM